MHKIAPNSSFATAIGSVDKQGLTSFRIAAVMSLLGTSRHSPRRNNSVAIGGIADFAAHPTHVYEFTPSTPDREGTAPNAA